MFEKKEGFEQIDNSEILWRYQDLPRYLDLLIRKQLFFTRIDHFEDPFEGKYNLIHNEAADLAEKQSKQRLSFTVNTWHINKDENYAMWNIYARNNGVAVQTNYQRLKDSFKDCEKPVYIGKVKYYNEANQQIPLNDPLAPFIHKRSMYEYENEIRCCYIMPKEQIWEEQGEYDGVFMDVDLDILIEKIYVSPYAAKWFRDLIERTNNKFGINKEIVHSTVFKSEYFT